MLGFDPSQACGRAGTERLSASYLRLGCRHVRRGLKHQGRNDRTRRGKRGEDPEGDSEAVRERRTVDGGDATVRAARTITGFR